MQADPVDALSADDFFELVEGLLVPPMAALGYQALHGYVNDSPRLAPLTLSGRGTPRKHPRSFEFGFEADSEEVMRLVGPDDPKSQDEWWVSYEPSTCRLTLRAWQPVAGPSVDWDIWLNDGPCSPGEVRRRLAAVGQAVSAFAAGHSG